MKLILEFESLSEATAWAKEITEATAGGILSGLVKELPAAKKEKADKADKKADPAGEEKKTVLDQLKDLGVQLSNKERYEGVQVCLAKYKVQKLKDIPEESQTEVLGMFTKMLEADKTKYEAMVDYLKS